MKPYLTVLTIVTVLLHQEPISEGKRWWRHVEVLASDALQGRNVGTPGLEKAIAYVETEFKSAGLKPAGVGGHRQPVKLESRTLVPEKSKVSRRLDGAELKLTIREDVTLNPRAEWDGPIEAPMVFVGYGLSIPEAGWDDLAGIDLRGKIAVFVNTPAPANISDN